MIRIRPWTRVLPGWNEGEDKRMVLHGPCYTSGQHGRHNRDGNNAGSIVRGADLAITANVTPTGDLCVHGRLFGKNCYECQIRELTP